MPIQTDGDRASPDLSPQSSPSSSSSLLIPVRQIRPPQNEPFPQKPLSITDLKEAETDRGSANDLVLRSVLKLAVNSDTTAMLVSDADGADPEDGLTDDAHEFEANDISQNGENAQSAPIEVLRDNLDCSSAAHSLECAVAPSTNQSFVNSPSFSVNPHDASEVTPESAIGSSEDSVATTRQTQEKEDSSPLFSPPLYRQRYYFVREILLRHGAKSVVDFGCAEPKLLSFLKFTHDFESLVGVDLLRLELEQGGSFQNMHVSCTLCAHVNFWVIWICRMSVLLHK